MKESDKKLMSRSNIFKIDYRNSAHSCRLNSVEVRNTPNPALPRVNRSPHHLTNAYSTTKNFTQTCSLESIKDTGKWLEKQKEMKMETATKRIIILKNIMTVCPNLTGLHRGPSFQFNVDKERKSISDMRREILNLLRRGKSIGTVSTADPSFFISVGVIFSYLFSVFSMISCIPEQKVSNQG